jgi:hypothetical protein
LLLGKRSKLPSVEDCQRQSVGTVISGLIRLTGLEDQEPPESAITIDRNSQSHLVEVAAGLFGLSGAGCEAAPVIDVKMLHAKIGELTLENDFLVGALTKAGLLSAKR